MTKLNTSGLNAGADNQVRELRYNLLRASSWLTNGTRKLLKPFGITPKQYSILSNLAESHPESSSIQEVRDGLAGEMSDASRLIDRLVAKGYLDKFPSDFDRRSNRVRISESGLKVLKKIDSQREEMDRLVSDMMTVEDLKTLNLLLNQLK